MKHKIFLFPCCQARLWAFVHFVSVSLLIKELHYERKIKKNSDDFGSGACSGGRTVVS